MRQSWCTYFMEPEQRQGWKSGWWGVDSDLQMRQVSSSWKSSRWEEEDGGEMGEAMAGGVEEEWKRWRGGRGCCISILIVVKSRISDSGVLTYGQGLCSVVQRICKQGRALRR